MKIWTAMKRLNRRYDAWALRMANGIVANLDRGPEDGTRERKRPISVWDLLPRKRWS
jgi:hypothetical protein